VNEGILFGLAAAIGFGASDTFAALVARRIGAIPAAVGSLLISLASLILVAVLLRPEIPADGQWIGPVLVLGAVTGVAYLCLVNALRLGPLSVISPLGASGGAVTVVLAVIVLGDRPGILEWLAVGITTTGAVLVAFVRTPGSRPRLNGPGPLFAIVAVLGYSVSVIGLQNPIRDVGWLPTLIAWRLANVAVAGTVFIVRRQTHRRPIVVPVMPSGDVVIVRDPLARRFALPIALLLAGVLESAGQVLRAFGLNVAPAWLVGLVNPLGPVVVISAGVLLLGERLGPSQWLGIGLVGAGIVLLAIS